MVTPDYACKLLDSKLKKNQEITKEELMELVDSISVESEGSITLTYSGPMGYRDAYGQNVSAKDEVERISRNHSETRTVDNTPAAKLLNDEVFKKAVASAFNVSPSEVERRGTEANQFLYDPVEGAWAKVSERFVANSNTKDDVRVIAPNANSNRVLAQSELPSMLDNEFVGRVEGVSTEVLKNMSLAEAFEVISEQSKENLRDVDEAQAIYENVAFSQNFSVREQVLAYDNYRNALCQLVDQKVDLFNQPIKHVNGQHLTNEKNEKQEQKQKENQEPEQDIQKLDGQSNNETISDFKSNLDSSPDVKSGSHSQLEQLIEKNIESLTQEPEQNQEKKQKPEQEQVKEQEQAQEQVQEQEQKENQEQKQDIQQMDKQDSDQKQEQDQNQEQSQPVQQLTR